MEIDYSEARKEIQTKLFFTQEDPSQAGFDRFFSADQRIPFSIAYPRKLNPHYTDTEYLYTLSVTFGPRTFSIVRADHTWQREVSDKEYLASFVPTSDSPLIRDLLKGVREWSDFGEAFALKNAWIAEGDEGLATVGNPPFKAARVIWEARENQWSEWVLFQVGLQIWTISRHPGSSISSDIFYIILQSFCFLDDEFFSALGIHHS